MSKNRLFNGISFVLSIGKPIWKPMISYTSGHFRIAFLFFSLIVVAYDFDMWLGTLVKLQKKWEQE